ncbi:hypothetical protein DsansV1_C06g0066261 [Dioscorea sansibarensis]
MNGQSDGTDDFLASYAVAASSLLPPSAKTSVDKITHVNALCDLHRFADLVGVKPYNAILVENVCRPSHVSFDAKHIFGQ